MPPVLVNFSALLPIVLLTGLKVRNILLITMMHPTIRRSQMQTLIAAYQFLWEKAITPSSQRVQIEIICLENINGFFPDDNSSLRQGTT